jgi:Fe-S-cluster-containing hydrogenase component 2
MGSRKRIAHFGEAQGTRAKWGLPEGGKLSMRERILTVYPDRCNGCRICELACSLEKERTCNPRKSRIRIIKDERRGIDLPLICFHCEDAPCMSICPTAAIKRSADGAVVLDEQLCIGCKACAVVCPYGAIFIDLEKRTMLKCDLCNGDPKCVKNCPADAIEFVRVDLFDWKKKKDAARKIIESMYKVEVSTPYSRG